MQQRASILFIIVLSSSLACMNAQLFSMEEELELCKVPTLQNLCIGFFLKNPVSLKEDNLHRLSGPVRETMVESSLQEPMHKCISLLDNHFTDVINAGEVNFRLCDVGFVLMTNAPSQRASLFGVQHRRDRILEVLHSRATGDDKEILAFFKQKTQEEVARCTTEELYTKKVRDRLYTKEELFQYALKRPRANQKVVSYLASKGLKGPVIERLIEEFFLYDKKRWEGFFKKDNIISIEEINESVDHKRNEILSKVAIVLKHNIKPCGKFQPIDKKKYPRPVTALKYVVTEVTPFLKSSEEFPDERQDIIASFFLRIKDLLKPFFIELQTTKIGSSAIVMQHPRKRKKEDKEGTIS